MQQRGEAMLCCFREEKEKTRGAHKKSIHLWFAILSSNDSKGARTPDAQRRAAQRHV